MGSDLVTTFGQAKESSTLAKGPGWVKAVTIHTGSKFGNDPRFAKETEEIVLGVADCGIEDVATGGGCSGKMGVANRAAIDLGLNLYGISLAFFDASQGDGYPGQKAAIAVDTMRLRMQVMRQGAEALRDRPKYAAEYLKIQDFQGTQVGITDKGGVGTLEEFFEWLVSRNGIVKPQVLNNSDGYYEPLKRFLEVCSDNLYKQGADVRRVYFEDGPKALVEKIASLNDKPALPEVEHESRKINRWKDFVEEREGANIVKPGAPLPVISRIFSQMTAYDVANVPNQTLWPHDSIKRFIFMGDYYKGIEGALDNAAAAELWKGERKDMFTRFMGDDIREARKIARSFIAKPVRVVDLGQKHSEGYRGKAIEEPVLVDV